MSEGQNSKKIQKLKKVCEEKSGKSRSIEVQIGELDKGMKPCD